MASNNRGTKLMVAAIDFGTTYSGYAYSTRIDYDRDPLLINSNRLWNAGIENFLSIKTPTAILFKPDMTFEAFGFEAEHRYIVLCDENKDKDSHFFRHFKLILHNNSTLNERTELTSLQGTRAPALTIFAESIKYLKDHLLQNLRSSYHGMECNDIQWVLTVPAIWDETAKQFMQKAAEQAGIQSDQLLIALEPEAASIYCRKLSVLRMITDTGAVQLEMFQPNTTYLVLDIGGGTADMTVHEISNDGLVREVTRSSGGTWGGLQVDKDFNKLMESIYGERVMKRFHEECAEDSFSLTKTFEFQKCHVKLPCDEWQTFALPQTLHQIFRAESLQDVPDVDLYGAVQRVKFVREKVRFKHSVLAEVFQPTIDGIISHVATLMADPAVQKAKYAFVVGGLSQSSILLSSLRTVFDRVVFIVPKEANEAVLKGAVLFGHDPSKAVAARRSVAAYGMEILRVFDVTVDPPEKRVVIDGQALCADVFDKFVDENEPSSEGRIVSKVCFPAHLNQPYATVMVYKSSNKEAKFITDEGVELIGSLIVDLKIDEENEKDEKEGMRTREWPVLVDFKLGGTVLKVDAVDVVTCNAVSARFDFLTLHQQ